MGRDQVQLCRLVCPADKLHRAFQRLPEHRRVRRLRVHGTTQALRNCRPSHTYSLPRGEYSGSFNAILSYTFNGSSYSASQTVRLRDILVVSLGDSYGSGEGNPDIPQPTAMYDGKTYATGPAKWVDKRCHRSAYAGPAQAARDLENADPHSTVTFISFACSGATINRNTFKDNDPNKPQGTGILGSYRGIDPPAGTGFTEAERLPSQVLAISRTLAGCAPTDSSCDRNNVGGVNTAGRRIDSLAISGGGNDAYFADIIVDCLIGSGGLSGPEYDENSAVARKISQGVSDLAGRYNAMAVAIHHTSPSDRPKLNVGQVVLTEYPDPTTYLDSSGQKTTCQSILGEILSMGLHLDQDESDWIRSNLMLPLTQKMKDAVAANGMNNWKFADGHGPQWPAHGYCADDHWVVRVYESARTQGYTSFPVPIDERVWVDPLTLGGQVGTMHPNRMGHRAYRNNIHPYFAQILSLPADDPLPTFRVKFSTPSGNPKVPGGTSQFVNGWITHSTLADGGTKNTALVTVTADDPAGIQAVSGQVSGDAKGTCPITSHPLGLACETVVESPTRTSWLLDLKWGGVYQLNFMAMGKDGQLGSFVQEIRVDIEAPYVLAAQPSRPPDGANSTYTAPVDIMLPAVEYWLGSGVARIEYTINGGAPVQIANNGKVTINTDGTHTISYVAIDHAGRRSTARTFTVKYDGSAPQTTITSAPPQFSPRSEWYFKFASSEPTGASFECKFDENPYAACTSPAHFRYSQGWHTFHVRARDAAGLVDATPATRRFMADWGAPRGQILINGGDQYTSRTGVTVSLGPTDPESSAGVPGSGVVGVQFSKDNVLWDAWQTYSSATPRKSYTLPTGNGLRYVYARFRDRAGNVSPAVSDYISLDLTRPTSTIRVRNGAPYTNTRTVPLNLTYADNRLSYESGVAQMRFSNTGTTYSEWKALSSYFPAWTMSTTNGARYVYVQFRDRAGNISAPYRDSIFLDTVRPVAFAPTHLLIAPVQTNSSYIPVKISWRATDTGGSGVMQYTLQRRQAAGAFGNVYLSSPLTTSITQTLLPDTYRYQMQAKDKAGNISYWRAGTSMVLGAIQENSVALSY